LDKERASGTIFDSGPWIQETGSGGLVFPALLAHLCQGSAVPDGHGDSSQRRRGGEQEAGAPETPLLWWVPAWRLVYRRMGSGQFAERHDLITNMKKGVLDRNLFPETTSMVYKGAIQAPKDTGIWILK
jgi:hypothetical protein